VHTLKRGDQTFPVVPLHPAVMPMGPIIRSRLCMEVAARGELWLIEGQYCGPGTFTKWFYQQPEGGDPRCAEATTWRTACGSLIPRGGSTRAHPAYM